MNPQAVMTSSQIEQVNEPKVGQKKASIIVKILTVMGMMSLMGGTLTGFMTYINLGLSDTFFADWFSAFALAAVTIMPIGFTLMVVLTKLTEKYLPHTSEKVRNVLIGLTMACLMESGIALSTVINNIGINDMPILLSTWAQTVLAAIPVALVMMITVSLTIKPKVEAILKS